MPGLGPMATVAGLTVLQPSPYLCQLLFILLRGLVGHERLALGVCAPGAFLFLFRSWYLNWALHQFQKMFYI